MQESLENVVNKVRQARKAHRELGVLLAQGAKLVLGVRPALLPPHSRASRLRRTVR